VPKPTKLDGSLLLQFFATTRVDEDARKAMLWLWETPAVNTYKEFKEKYPIGSEGYRNFVTAGMYFETLGVMVYHNLLHEDLVFDAFALLWEKTGVVVKGMQKEYKSPRMFENYEWLASRMSEWLKKHPPKLSKRN
jgi:hypothetical protein